MKTWKARIVSALLVIMTLLTMLPTSALAASGTGKGITITKNQNYWSTRLLANGTPYSYRPPMAAGRLLYCLDSGLGYHNATQSFFDSYAGRRGIGLSGGLSGAGTDRQAVLAADDVRNNRIDSRRPHFLSAGLLLSIPTNSTLNLTEIGLFALPNSILQATQVYFQSGLSFCKNSTPKL